MITVQADSRQGRLGRSHGPLVPDPDKTGPCRPGEIFNIAVWPLPVLQRSSAGVVRLAGGGLPVRAGKNETGLDHYQVRRYDAWYPARHAVDARAGVPDRHRRSRGHHRLWTTFPEVPSDTGEEASGAADNHCMRGRPASALLLMCVVSIATACTASAVAPHPAMSATGHTATPEATPSGHALGAPGCRPASPVTVFNRFLAEVEGTGHGATLWGLLMFPHPLPARAGDQERSSGG
jgi:hypothetical protein